MCWFRDYKVHSLPRDAVSHQISKDLLYLAITFCCQIRA